MQIKARSYLQVTGSIQMQLTQGPEARHYTKDDIDVFAIYVEPFDRWYIIDVRLLLGRSQSVTFKPNPALSPFRECEEDWGNLIPST